MTEMLTAKEMQARLQVDRSTIYRMAEAGQIPAIKVGKQWRFPADQVNAWFGAPVATPAAAQPSAQTADDDLTKLLPLDCVQLVQDTFADLLGVTMVITDMDGRPISQISHPCGLFDLVRQNPEAWQACIDTWKGLAHELTLEPHYIESHLGLPCTRAMIRVGPQLKGMVVAGFIAPDQWPPATGELEQMARQNGLEPEQLVAHAREVCYLEKYQRAQVQQFIQRIANIITHMADERVKVVNKMSAIADLIAL